MRDCTDTAQKLDVCRGKLEILQVNLGDLCNQRCAHCHVGASPKGTHVMSRKVVDDILSFMADAGDLILDITGGAPELNPSFDHLVRSARPLAKEILVRSNLTVFFEQGREYLPGFFKGNRVHLICSLPCYTEENVDKQRGNGVFKKSIKGLMMLNELGFGGDDGLELDLVYNPPGPFLPGRQDELEVAYKRVLGNEYGVSFNRLITITNVPITRFGEQLRAEGTYDGYMDLLRANFNAAVLESLMCKHQLSVAYEGTMYDCDFNMALGMVLEDAEGRPLTIDRINSAWLTGCQVITDDHCLSCTAGFGSSCQGALTEARQT